MKNTLINNVTRATLRPLRKNFKQVQKCALFLIRHRHRHSHQWVGGDSNSRLSTRLFGICPIYLPFPSPCSGCFQNGNNHCPLIAFPGSQDRTRRQASFFKLSKFPIAPSDYEVHMWALSTSSEVAPRSGVEPPFYRHHSNAAALEKVRVLFPLKSSV